MQGEQVDFLDARGAVGRYAQVDVVGAEKFADAMAALATWQQGHFLNFNGLTRWVATLWPFLTLPFLLLIVRRP